MTAPSARVVSAVAGVLLGMAPLGAQTVAPPLIRSDVASPSSEFRTYVEGEIVRVSIPANWRELPGSSGVTFAPDGAYGNAGTKSVFTHGLGIGLVRNDWRDLQLSTDAFVDALAEGRAHAKLRYHKVIVSGRPALRVVVSTVSQATGEPERIEVFTTLLHDGRLLYLLAKTPPKRASAYAATFRRIMGSIQIMDDCDPCAPPSTRRP